MIHNTAYAECNLEIEMPTVREAVANMRQFLDICRKNRTRWVLFIHGYGSSGKGGAICKEVRQILISQKKKGKIKRVIPGEEMTIFNDDARTVKNQCPPFACYMGVYNHGITIVEL